MQKLFVLGMCLMMSAGLAFGQNLSLGAHGAYSVGGDVETETFGYGGQVGVSVGEFLSLELSATLFSDEPETDEIDADEGGETIPGLDYDIDITHIALTARCGVEVLPNVKIYGGGGASYNMFDIDGIGIDALSGALADDPMLQAFLGAGGTLSGGIDFDVDNAIGYHVAAGVSFMVTEMIELFAEYRFTWMEVDLEASANIRAVAADGTVVYDEAITEDLGSADYNFGLARVGVNIVL